MSLPLILGGLAAAGLLAAKVIRDKKLTTPVQVAAPTAANPGATQTALTGTNGVVFVQQSPQITAANPIPPDQFMGIIVSDLVTVDADRGGLVSASIPSGSGNVLMQVVKAPDQASMTLAAVSKDPRNDINDLLPKMIPSVAITGVQPTK